MSIIGAIFKAPFKAINWSAKKVKNAMGSEDENESPIDQVITSKYPIPYRYYFESQGQKTDLVRGQLIVWRKNIKKKEREKALKQLLGIT